MQPKPSSETSRLLFPNLRFCIVPPMSLGPPSNRIHSAPFSSRSIKDTLEPLQERLRRLRCLYVRCLVYPFTLQSTPFLLQNAPTSKQSGSASQLYAVWATAHSKLSAWECQGPPFR